MTNNNQKVENPTKIKTGVVRLSYANIWTAKSINGGTPKYSASVLIPKSDTVTVQRIKAAVQAAYEEGESKLKGNGKFVPPLASLKTPLRDGDIERPDDEAYKGHWFVNANSNTAPGVVDINREPIYDTKEIYSGVYARVCLSFYAFNSSGSKGIACGLQSLQKVKDGEPLGGRSKPEDDFDDGFNADDDFLA
ncbi:MAG: hypothetical protein A2Y17_11345 [Clostridiales bacterium GWF2_38_85]|nr:MAG: hypothetical protein A2Y17_11345 [Clostridiales bacterium GWF2_38_85]HBL84719.1 DUF2815 domain-containing protein [Clostridiales bacterium]